MHLNTHVYSYVFAYPILQARPLASFPNSSAPEPCPCHHAAGQTLHLEGKDIERAFRFTQRPQPFLELYKAWLKTPAERGRPAPPLRPTL
eukprot:1396077-Pleurochrysis_carterae.AAC.1